MKLICIEEKRVVLTVSSKKGLDATSNTSRSQRKKVDIYICPVLPHSR